jgi:thiol-disulfide isomerase/thioredoxin
MDDARQPNKFSEKLISMNSATPAAPDPSMQGHLSEEVLAAFDQAHELQREGQVEAAIAKLETTLANLASEAGLAQFKERVSLVMAIAEFSVSAGDSEKAISGLATEFGRAKEAFQQIKATGTEDDKRMAFRGLVQLRDLHTRLKLIGEPAPELSVKEWLNSEPLTLAELKGKVVLLEFWATWCKPCEQMFPRVKEFHKPRAAQGLEVLALTRFFMAYGGPPEAQAREMNLVREFTAKHNIEFPTGVSEDESLQNAYGATALPMFALIDRAGLVRGFSFSPDDESFKQQLEDCLLQNSQIDNSQIESQRRPTF